MPFHELGRAGLPVGLDARQRVPTGVMAPMRDLGTTTLPAPILKPRGLK